MLTERLKVSRPQRKMLISVVWAPMSTKRMRSSANGWTPRVIDSRLELGRRPTRTRCRPGGGRQLLVLVQDVALDGPDGDIGELGGVVGDRAGEVQHGLVRREGQFARGLELDHAGQVAHRRRRQAQVDQNDLVARDRQQGLPGRELLVRQHLADERAERRGLAGLDRLGNGRRDHPADPQAALLERRLHGLQRAVIPIEREQLAAAPGQVVSEL